MLMEEIRRRFACGFFEGCGLTIPGNQMSLSQGEEGILMVRESLCNVDAETAGAWCLEVSLLRDVS